MEDKLDLETAFGILFYLGIKKDKIEDAYFELISPENYLKSAKEYITISKN